MATAPPIEGYAPVVLQTTCDPTPKPGVVAFRDLVLASRGGSDLGIVRACEDPRQSEHKEGRAWDWGGLAAPDPRADALLAWLLAADAAGNPHAVFRRLGLMYVIWNGRIWSTGSRAWRAYTGPNPHTDHMHFSFGWPGARAETSFFARGDAAPAPSSRSAFKLGAALALGAGLGFGVVRWAARRR